jgi:hypothetical protein
MPFRTHRRRATSLVAGIGLGALVAVGTVTPASAADAPSAYSVAFKAKEGSVAVNTTVTGVVGWLLGPIVDPALDALVDPLVSGLANLPSRVIGPLLGAVVGPLSATTPGAGTPVAAPFSYASGASPNCVTAASCYSSIRVAAAVPPLLTLDLQAASGIVENVAGVGYVSQSRLAGVHLNALGIDLLRVSAAHATAQTTLSGAPITSGTSTASNISILNDLVRAEVANTGGVPLLTASVGGAALSVGSVQVLAGGIGTVQLDGSLLRVGLNIDVEQLLTMLGLGALATLVSNIATLKASVNLVIGGGSVTATGSTESWGLGVGVGIALDVSLDVLGLVGLKVKVSDSAPASTQLGNLLDLRLAYSNASGEGGTVVRDTWIAPGLT